MPVIVFSHANGFPANTYRLIFDGLRGRGFTIEAIDCFGHDARYPVTDNWPHLARQLSDFAREQVQRHGQPAYFVGHSLGGYLSTLAAAHNPELCRGVLLLDSPLFSRLRAAGVQVVKKTPLIARVSPGGASRRRRTRWDSKQEAMAYFSAKPVFSRWHPHMLHDYVEHGLKNGPEGSTLLFERDIETAIYYTVAHNISSVLRQTPLQCPLAFIGGRQSRELRLIGTEHTRRATQGRMMMLDGTHLFPMESPQATIAAIEASLHNLAHVSRMHTGSSPAAIVPATIVTTAPAAMPDMPGPERSQQAAAQAGRHIFHS